MISLQSIGFMGPGVSLLCLRFAQTPSVAAVLMTVALSLSSFCQAGYFCNIQVMFPSCPDQWSYHLQLYDQCVPLLEYYFHQSCTSIWRNVFSFISRAGHCSQIRWILARYVRNSRSSRQDMSFLYPSLHSSGSVSDWHDLLPREQGSRTASGRWRP